MCNGNTFVFPTSLRGGSHSLHFTHNVTESGKAYATYFRCINYGVELEKGVPDVGEHSFSVCTTVGNVS